MLEVVQSREGEPQARQAKQSGRIGELFSGARILLVSFVGTGIGVSTSFLLSFSIFVKPLTEELNVGRGAVSMAPLIVNIVLALLIPFVGRLVDRVGAMPVALASGVAYAAALVCLGLFTASVWSYLGLVVLLALAGAGSTPPPYTKLVISNFDRIRGVALGIALSGVGLGTALISSLLAPYIDEHGWRSGYLMLGASVLAGVCVMAVLWASAGKGGHAFAKAGVQSSGAGPAPGELPLVRNPVFWVVSAAFYFAAFGVLSLISHFVPMLTDSGLTLAEAGVIAGSIGLSMVAGRIVTGFLLDVVGAELLGVILFLVAAGGMLLLAFGGKDFALVAAVIAGFGIGAEIDIMAFLTGKYFGLRRYGVAYGSIYGIFLVGSSSGPAVAGFLFDHTGSYREALVVASCSLALAALLLALLGRMPVRANT
jgi:MFS family permease